jgi:hypothetical protein
MRRFLMRDEDGNTCPKCGGTGRLRNYRTMSPPDDEPCPCTRGTDDDEDAET